MIALLPKQVGGWKPIGLFASSYRLHGRLRRPYAVSWENDLARPYLAAGASTGAADVVWRQAVRSEFATGSRGPGVACSVLWDLHKFYELVDLGLLQER
eukprot:1104941-Pyramimonas_sp.AAC.1